MKTIRALIDVLGSANGKHFVLLIIFITGVLFEAFEHHVLGAELIAVAVAHLLPYRRGE
jgi:hypothetical protein